MDPEGAEVQFPSPPRFRWGMCRRGRKEKAAVTPFGKPVETMHNAYPVGLDSVRSLKVTWRSDTSSPMNSSRGPLKGPKSIYDMTWPKQEVAEYLKPPPIKPQPPHFAHHHHFGWAPAQMNDRVADDITDFSHSQHKKYGDALKYCQTITSKSQPILTKRA
mmetsp:Transcript_55025/g.174992  ORF Transcript_55025/g.174992 Transcript_55025/m.174992 type:complete len:161 (+) Transcript_55025:3065-3547(+)